MHSYHWMRRTQATCCAAITRESGINVDLERKGMMQRLSGKLHTIGRIFRQQGFRGIGSVTAQKIGMWYRRTGNAVRLDGCVFDLEGLSEDISSLLLRG